MSATGEQLRSYLRGIPGTTEDLSLWLNAAAEILESAGVPPRTGSAQYDMAQLRIAATLYLERDDTDITETEAAGRRAMFNATILPLRYGGD